MMPLIISMMNASKERSLWAEKFTHRLPVAFRQPASECSEQLSHKYMLKVINHLYYLILTANFNVFR